MAQTRYNSKLALGVGVGFRAPHTDEVLGSPEAIAVDWFEIIAENYMLAGGRPLETLAQLSALRPVVVHGVGLYVGNTDGIDVDHLARLREVLVRARAPWVTDHLCWGSVGGRMSHDLLPLPYTKAAVAVAVENIKRVQGELALPFAIENVSSYVEFAESEMTEWQFLNEVLAGADCGLLLDVNNIYVSSRNHGFDPRAYLDAIDPSRVAQIHLAGHQELATCIVDTHDQPVRDEVWALYAHALRRLGPTPTLLEWDAQLPSFAALQTEALRATTLLAQAVPHAA